MLTKLSPQQSGTLGELLAVAHDLVADAIPRSAKRSSTFRRLSGHLTYSISAGQITSGEVLKW